MADMYKKIDELLTQKGISGAKMSNDLGMSRSFMTELRKGRAKSVKLETAQKIADYLGVSLEYLLDGETKNPPAPEGGRSVTDEEIKFAIALAMKDKNPQVQSFWNAVSHSGKIPKPKKIITILSTNLQNKIHS